MKVRATVFAVVGCVLSLVVLGRSAYAVNCTHDAASASGTISTSGAGSQTCGDGTSCGQTVTYNPPQPPGSQQCVPQPNKCCVDQLQRPYTQTFSCRDHDQNPATPTQCVAGPKNYFGTSASVKVTVDCNGTACSEDLPEY